MGLFTKALFSSLCLLLLCSASFAQVGYRQEEQATWWGSRRGFQSYQAGQCRLESLSIQEPMRRVQSEAGFTEYFEESNEQFQCVGVAALRRTVEPRGLLLPSYSSSPRLVYIIQGRGLSGMVMPGCPESYQSFRQTEAQLIVDVGESQRQMVRDEHQKIRRCQQGDIIVVPAGVAYWFYNDGDSPVVAVTVFDTSSNANQLEPRRREFLLAGRQQRSQQYAGRQDERLEHSNVLAGFDHQMLIEAFGIDSEMARRIQNPEQSRGEIVRVKSGLHMMTATVGTEYTEEEEEFGRSQRRQEESRGCGANGLEEAYCYMKKVENIGNPMRSDVYNPRWGRLTSLNSQKLPILQFIQMSAERGVLHRNAMSAPHWNINAHSVMYVIRGSCRMQVVGHRGKNVFDGELRQGQLIVIPQNYAVMKRSESESFEWISFKTNGNAMVSQIVGKASALRGMPVEVIMSSYQISREEAKRLKFNRGNEMSIFSARRMDSMSA